MQRAQAGEGLLSGAQCRTRNHTWKGQLMEEKVLTQGPSCFRMLLCLRNMLLKSMLQLYEPTMRLSISAFCCCCCYRSSHCLYIYVFWRGKTVYSSRLFFPSDFLSVKGNIQLISSQTFVHERRQGAITFICCAAQMMQQGNHHHSFPLCLNSCNVYYK